MYLERTKKTEWIVSKEMTILGTIGCLDCNHTTPYTSLQGHKKGLNIPKPKEKNLSCHPNFCEKRFDLLIGITIFMAKDKNFPCSFLKTLITKRDWRHMAVNIFKLRSTILIRPLARPKYRALGHLITEGTWPEGKRRAKRHFFFLVLLLPFKD